MEEDEELFNTDDEEQGEDDDSLADEFDDALDLQDVIEADLEEDPGEAEVEEKANAPNSDDGHLQAQEMEPKDLEPSDEKTVDTPPPVISTAATSNTGLSEDDDEDEGEDDAPQKVDGKTSSVPQMSKKDKRRAKERRKKEEQEQAAKSGTGSVSRSDIHKRYILSMLIQSGL